MNSLRSYVFSILAITLSVGCGGAANGPTMSAPATSGKVSVPWLGIPSACLYVTQCIHEGTSWVLDRNQVKVIKVSEVRSTTGNNSFVAEFQITVNNGTNSFETVAREVACDTNGIPTEQSVTKLREAVEDIKAKIKRLQNY